ncbi:MAG: hypothetical protein IH987_02655 [Planctomycetes bacterium]|nr:hypothetical protein [Planctomycetota bacterium]
MRVNGGGAARGAPGHRRDRHPEPLPVIPSEGRDRQGMAAVRFLAALGMTEAP